MQSNNRRKWTIKVSTLLNARNYIMCSKKFLLRERENPIVNIAVISPSPAAVPPMASSLAAQSWPLPPTPAGASASPYSVAARTPIATTTPAATRPVGTANKDGGGSTALTFHETEWLEAIQSVLEQDLNAPALCWSKIVIKAATSCRDSIIFFVYSQFFFQNPQQSKVRLSSLLEW